MLRWDRASNSHVRMELERFFMRKVPDTQFRVQAAQSTATLSHFQIQDVSFRKDADIR
jgi:hypothetical protein